MVCAWTVGGLWTCWLMLRLQELQSQTLSGSLLTIQSKSQMNSICKMAGVECMLIEYLSNIS